MIYNNFQLDEMIHARTKSAKSNRGKRLGFTLVELTISIAVIGILMAVLIPVFATIVNSADRNSAQQSMETSYESILNEDYGDGYADEYANGVLVYKKKKSTVYFMIVTDGAIEDTVYKVSKVQRSAHAYDIMVLTEGVSSTSGTPQSLAFVDTPNAPKEATSYIVNSKAITGATFTWSDEGFNEISNYTIITNGQTNSFETNKRTTESEASYSAPGYVIFEDVTDYVAFYSIGEGVVTVSGAEKA